MAKVKKKPEQVSSLHQKQQPATTKEANQNSHINSNQLRPKQLWSWHLMKAFVIATVVLAIYVKTLHPSLPGGDSGELIVASHEFGVAHPPGYPLFTLMAKAAMVMIPIGGIAWRVNLMTAVTSAIAGGLMYLALARLTNQDSPGILAVGFFCFSRLTWTWSVTAEVFGLNNLLIALLLVLAVWFEEVGVEKKGHKVVMLGAFACGLTLCNQHTAILYIACIVLWVIISLCRNQMLSVKLVLKMCVCFLMGLLPYVYIPIAAYVHVARWTWGDQRTLHGFFKHLFRREYGTFDLLKDHTGQGLYHSIRIYLEHISTDFSPGVLLLFILSTVSVGRRLFQRLFGAVCVFYLMLFAYVLFFCWRANLDIENPLLLGVVERFWMQSDLVVAILAAVTFHDITSWISTRVPVYKWRFDMLLVLAMSVLQIHKNMSYCDQSNNFVVRDFALSVLKSFPEGSIVLTKGDLPANTLRYFYLCENIRPDLAMFDQEVLTYEWSLPMTGKFHPGIIFPGELMHLHTGVMDDGRQSFNFRTLLDINYQKPIFGCIGVQDHDPSWKNGYEFWPFGVCSQFIKKGSSLNLSQWVQKTARQGFDWKYPFTGYPDTSWEKVATEQVWAAKTASALFLLENAESLTPGPEKLAILTYSYQLYTSALESHRDFPSYWHKNFALVCEKLMRTDTDLDKTELLRKSIRHFKKYMNESPDDPDGEKITSAINTLHKYLDQLELGS